MISVERFTAKDQKNWDDFVLTSKIDVFFFQRNYMDYHSDRFLDHSLLFYKKGILIALLPANEQEHSFISHGGLTFGGIISNQKMTTPLMLSVFDVLLNYLKKQGIHRFIYKRTPYIYHALPADEDAYALFYHDAKLYRREVASTVHLPSRVSFQERRRRAVKKAKKAELTVYETEDYETYWEMLRINLKTVHNLSPPHTAKEMLLLQKRFPQNIRLFAVSQNDQMLAGTWIFENVHIAHAQYISSHQEGRKIGALDMLFSHLVLDVFAEKRYFNFGVSSEDGGKTLNSGLIEQKEGFGARTVLHDFYKLEF
jgi:hypothetical protein